MNDDILIGGPIHQLEDCLECGKEHMVYRAGSWDWKPKKCFDCNVKSITASLDASFLKESEEK